MAFDTTTHGAFRIDGQWATSIGFRMHEEDGQTRQVDLRFNNDGKRIIELTVNPDQARVLLGERNFAALHEASAVDKPTPGQDHGIVTRTGRLHGQTLAYREAVWHGPPQDPENSIGPTPPERQAGTSQEAESGERLKARDAVVGAAHLAQVSELGGPAMHGVSQAIGAADAVKVVVDLARGEKVRPVDAAGAAASVAMGTGLGGEATQAAAKAVAAGAAMDTAQRATNTASAMADGARQDNTLPPMDREDERRRRRALQSAVPDTVNQRFIRVNDEYYFPDRTLAFTDHGGKLQSKSENVEVIRSLVAIAEAREWWSVTVSGSEQFRREVWREGVRQGIEVHGYQPSGVERVQLRRSLGLPEPGADRTVPNDLSPAKGAERQGAPDHAASPSPNNGASSTTVTGRLLAHGAAPYRFDPTNGLSYHATVRNEAGEHTLWGVDLERAIVESRSGVKVGDEVTIENRGSAAVKVKVPRRDDNGSVIGHDDITTHRNSWTVETTAHLAQRQRSAQTLRSGGAADRQAASSDPQLLNAMVGVWLSEQFAQRYIGEAADRDRLVDRVKARLAQAIEQGETITAPQLRRDVNRVLAGSTDSPGEAKPSGPGRPTPERDLEEPPYVHVQ